MMMLGKPSPYRTYLVFFRGEFSYWSAIRHLLNISITYEQLLSTFLKDLNKSSKTTFTSSDVIFSCLNNGEKIIDLHAKVPTNFNSTDFYVQPRNFESHEQNQLIAPPPSYNFVEKGRSLEKCGNIRGAMAFYEAANLYGIKDLAQILFKNRNWEDLKNYIEHLQYFFPDDIPMNHIIAKYYENMDEPEKALKIYKKLRDSSMYMKVAYFRKSPENQNNLANFIPLTTKSLASQEGFDPLLLNELIHLSYHFKKYKVGIELCLRHVETIKHLSLFSKNILSYDRVIKRCSTPNNGDYAQSITIIEILYKNGDTRAAFGIAKAIQPDNPLDFQSFSRVYAYINLLFIDYRFDELIKVFSTFFSYQEIPNIANFDSLMLIFKFAKIPIFNVKKPEDSYYGGIFLTSEEENYLFLIYITMVKFLFIQGYIDECKIIAERLIVAIAKIPDFENFYDPIFSLVKKVIQRPIACSTSTMKTLIIGDEFSVLGSFVKYGKNAVINQFIPKPFSGLRIWNLRNEKESGIKTKFFDVLNHFSNDKKKEYQYSGIMFCLGTHDCEESISKLVKKFKFKTVQEAIDSIAAILIGIVNRFHESFPSFQIFVHAAFPRYKWSAILTNAFNDTISQKLPQYVQFVNPFPTASILDTVPINQKHQIKAYPNKLIGVLDKI
ncbi:hypothetical protein TRFO_42683 [Tritrichomonas foetus]|uniref:Uncharacterized protein n=1 Tax=Tritrichomonas foetus TaxID=1144522 RepID=A0A1J4KVH2_9EUKA|nr:hypothetical protein TRFO_42683 [Tritrichomonas foetus]|eukprot:OHT15146.1 hypothetical protein TRFO_42683 [Tritrichomonas foetus]